LTNRRGWAAACPHSAGCSPQPQPQHEGAGHDRGASEQAAVSRRRRCLHPTGCRGQEKCRSHAKGAARSVRMQLASRGQGQQASSSALRTCRVAAMCTPLCRAGATSQILQTGSVGPTHWLQAKPSILIGIGFDEAAAGPQSSTGTHRPAPDTCYFLAGSRARPFCDGPTDPVRAFQRLCCSITLLDTGYGSRCDDETNARLLHFPPTPRRRAPTPRWRSITHNSWHGKQFRQFPARRVVAPPVVAAATAALAAHGRAHSVPQQAGGLPAGFQAAQTLLRPCLLEGPELDGRADGRARRLDLILSLSYNHPPAARNACVTLRRRGVAIVAPSG
jgi:hypothetical protein